MNIPICICLMLFKFYITIANKNPYESFPNFKSTTLARSYIVVLRIHSRLRVYYLPSPCRKHFSSQTFTVFSLSLVAITVPHIGGAHLTRATGPSCGSNWCMLTHLPFWSFSWKIILLSYVF
jgi:hypothetical protein